MLMECSILLMGNSVKWQGGDINGPKKLRIRKRHKVLKFIRYSKRIMWRKPTTHVV